MLFFYKNNFLKEIQFEKNHFKLNNNKYNNSTI